MSPGFGGPNIESTPNNTNSESDRFALQPEDCSLSDPTDRISIEQSIDYSQQRLKEIVERAKSEVESANDSETVKDKKIAALEFELEKIEDRHSQSEPGTVEEKLCYYLMKVLGSKYEDLCKIRPINKRLAEGRPPKSPSGQSRQARRNTRANRPV